MILGLYQTKSPAGDISAGMRILERALEHAAASGVDMLTLPELFLPGYNACVNGEYDVHFHDFFCANGPKI